MAALRERGVVKPYRSRPVPRSKRKIYVQDKLREQGAELWRWINDGAHIYVCGDAGRMAADVEKALLEVIAEFGAMDIEAADEFLSELRVERRYQRDVY